METLVLVQLNWKKRWSVEQQIPLTLSLGPPDSAV